MEIPKQAQLTIDALNVERKFYKTSGLEWVDTAKAQVILGVKSRQEVKRMIDAGEPIAWRYKNKKQRVYGVNSMYDFMAKKIMDNIKDYK